MAELLVTARHTVLASSVLEKTELPAHEGAALVSFLESLEGLLLAEALLTQLASDEPDLALWSRAFRIVISARLRLPERSAADVRETTTDALIESARSLVPQAFGTTSSRGSLPGSHIARCRRYLEELATSQDLIRSAQKQSDWDQAFTRLRRLALEDHERRSIAVPGAARPIPVSSLYVVPNLVPMTDENAAGGPDSHASRRPLAQVLATADRHVILGDPGAGKTTLANYIAATVNRHESNYARLGLVVTLRKINFESGDGHAPLVRETQSEIASLSQTSVDLEFVTWLLESGRIALFADGLDELIRPGLRQAAVKEVGRFATAHPAAPVFVTSRLVGYQEAPLSSETFAVSTLAPFSANQIHEYAAKVFDRLPQREDSEDPTLQTFLAGIEPVADLVENPLLLALICDLYQSIGYIPTNRPEIFRQCAELLFHRWDGTRLIRASPDSLPVSIRWKILGRIAMLYLTSGDYNSSGATSEQLEVAVRDYLETSVGYTRQSATEGAAQFIDFATGRAWILSDTGSDRSGISKYEFTHRTFLEFFAAAHLVASRRDPERLARDIADLTPLLDEASLVPELALQLFAERDERGASDLVRCLLEAAFSRTGELTMADSVRIIQIILRASRHVPLDINAQDELGAIMASSLSAEGQRLHPFVFESLADVASSTFGRSQPRQVVEQFSRIVTSLLSGLPDSDQIGTSQLLATIGCAFSSDEFPEYFDKYTKIITQSTELLATHELLRLRPLAPDAPLLPSHLLAPTRNPRTEDWILPACVQDHLLSNASEVDSDVGSRWIYVSDGVVRVSYPAKVALEIGDALEHALFGDAQLALAQAELDESRRWLLSLSISMLSTAMNERAQAGAGWDEQEPSLVALLALTETEAALRDLSKLPLWTFDSLDYWIATPPTGFPSIAQVFRAASSARRLGQVNRLRQGVRLAQSPLSPEVFELALERSTSLWSRLPG